MQPIDEARLETDVDYRVGSVSEFMGFSDCGVSAIHGAASLGFVADALTATILEPGLERECEQSTLWAFSKLLWLQNDLINRHYQEAKSMQPAEMGIAAE